MPRMLSMHNATTYATLYMFVKRDELAEHFRRQPIGENDI